MLPAVDGDAIKCALPAPAQQSTDRESAAPTNDEKRALTKPSHSPAAYKSTIDRDHAPLGSCVGSSIGVGFRVCELASLPAGLLSAARLGMPAALTASAPVDEAHEKAVCPITPALDV